MTETMEWQDVDFGQVEFLDEPGGGPEIINRIIESRHDGHADHQPAIPS